MALPGVRAQGSPLEPTTPLRWYYDFTAALEGFELADGAGDSDVFASPFALVESFFALPDDAASSVAVPDDPFLS